MKILFIYPNRGHQEALSTGLSYISGWLKQNSNNHNIKLFDFTWNENIYDCYKLIKQFQPNIIGITLSSMDFEFCKKLIFDIRKISKSKIVLGGIHPTVAPEESIAFADIICIGEGEGAFGELVDKLEKNEDITDIKNLWIKNRDKVVKNELRDLIQDLDSLYCDRNLFDIWKYVKARNYTMDVYAGRGCPYNCFYCINYILNKAYNGKGKIIRLRSPENIINEIKDLKKKFSLKQITFPDDTFTYNKKWLIEFCNLYKKEIKLPFVCNARVENLDEEVIKNLKQANCYALKIGIESGSTKIRKEILNRFMSNAQIINAFQLCKKYNIKTLSFNMVGIPTETKRDMLKTIQINRYCQPTEISVTIWIPFPGTHLFNEVLEKGWLTDKKVSDYKLGSIMQYDYITSEEIKKVRDYFSFNVFVKINILKAVRTLMQERLFNFYNNYRSKIPLFIRKIVQSISNKV